MVKLLLLAVAVGGLALMAVTLLGGPTPGEKVALEAADRVAAAAGRDAAEQPAEARTFGRWSSHYASECNKVAISHSGAASGVTPNFSLSPALSADDEVSGALVDVRRSDDDVVKPAWRRAVAQCKLH